MSTKAQPKMPKGIAYIVGNEAAERFSFYGMKVVLFTFLTEYMVTNTGESDFLTKTEANVWIHTFVYMVYLLPIAGAVLSDAFWGKYKTIMVLSVVYCAGHIALALDETRLGMILGLTLIAIGSGGIKPCVSSHVGDQFGPSNESLISKVYSYFYMSINIGAAISQLLTPILLATVGPWLAFGLPGALMILATIIFWAGRNQYTAVEPVGWNNFVAAFKTKDALNVIGKIGGVFSLVSVFWTLFDQSASSLTAQAKHELVDRNLKFIDVEILGEQVQAINPILVLILVPIFTFFVYPTWERKKGASVKLLSRASVGMLLAGFSYMILIFIQTLLDGGESVSIYWQFFSYLILTTAEVMVSISVLEFAYTQAPAALKSLVMGMNLLAVFLGNFITMTFNAFIMDGNGNSILTDVEYFSFFTILMFVTAIVFVFVARSYKEQRVVQSV